MPKRTADFGAYRQERLEDPVVAAAYLNAAYEDSPEIFLEAVKDVLQTRSVSEVARQAGLTRESLYRTFSANGNPTLSTLHAVLRVLSLKLTVSAQDKSLPSHTDSNAHTYLNSYYGTMRISQVQYGLMVLLPVVAGAAVLGTLSYNVVNQVVFNEPPKTFIERTATSRYGTQQYEEDGNVYNSEKRIG